MGNSYFQFKQFRVDQDKCAMKVTTEGCILGAWAQFDYPNRILDIGTGTGLLSLMLAQKYDCPIDALELDLDAAEQANRNFKSSKWKERLHLFNTDANQLSTSVGSKYDLIISNPPFYSNSLKSPKQSVNMARHDTTLSQEQLCEIVSNCLNKEGSAFVLYPEMEANALIEISTVYGLHPSEVLEVRNGIDKNIFRKILKLVHLDASGSRTNINELIIRNSENDYTNDFKELLMDYYLNF